MRQQLAFLLYLCLNYESVLYFNTVPICGCMAYNSVLNMIFLLFIDEITTSNPTATPTTPPTTTTPIGGIPYQVRPSSSCRRQVVHLPHLRLHSLHHRLPRTHRLFHLYSRVRDPPGILLLGARSSRFIPSQGTLLTTLL